MLLSTKGKSTIVVAASFDSSGIKVLLEPGVENNNLLMEIQGYEQT